MRQAPREWTPPVHWPPAALLPRARGATHSSGGSRIDVMKAPRGRAYLWRQTGLRLPIKASMPSPASWNIMLQAISLPA